MAATAPLDTLSMDDLRQRRLTARRALEYARLRARQGDGSSTAIIEEMDSEVRDLTDELIARYAADLALVDSLLDPAYPAGGTEPGRAGR